MSTVAHTPEVISKPGRVGMIVAALVTLIAVAAVLVVSLPGGSHALVPREVGARYVPLIQYHGTGAPLTAAGSSVDPAQPGGPAYIRAEHSYGMVP
jgi:hypothetical protein